MFNIRATRRRIAVLILVLPLAALAIYVRMHDAAAQLIGPMQAIEVDATPIASFDRTDPQRVTFGKLEWRGGLVLTSNAADFGGWSGLIADPTGQKIVAVSDRLRWLRAGITYAGDRPAGIVNAELGPLAPEDHAMKGLGHDRDAEAIVLLAGTIDKGELLISFERKARLARLAMDGNKLSPVTGYLKPPPEAELLVDNRGFEAVTMVRGGSQKGAILAIAEHFPDAEDHHSGWLWVNGEPARFALAAAKDFDISDAVSLDDGALIVLERRASLLGGLAMRLRYVAPGSIKPGAVVEGEVLFESGDDQEIDNMEAIAVHRNDKGETILTIMSDDNFSYYLQKTILLQFALSPEFAGR